MDFGIAGVAVITVIAYLVGLAVKATALPNRWIPVICAAVGGARGVAGLYTMPDFPAADMLTAIAVGIVSGLAATGIHQTVKQLGSQEMDDNG